MKVFISRKTQIYPTPEQAEHIQKLINLRRGCWNQLHEWYKDVPVQAMDQFTTAKQLVALPWTENRALLNTVAADYKKAWRSCFRKITRRPDFKSKFRSSPSVSFTPSMPVTIDKGKAPLFGFGRKRVQLAEHFTEFKQAPIKRLTYSFRADKYYISLTWEIDKLVEESGSGTIGLDWGVGTFLTASDGSTHNLPARAHKISEKINQCNRVLSRKVRGSANYVKARTKLNDAHAKLVNIKKDFLNKLALFLVRNNSVITIEDLDLVALRSQSHSGRRYKMSLNTFGTFRDKLLYKAQFYTARVYLADRYYPSSQICSTCGSRQHMPEHVRVYSCSCGLNIDRDLNAALNLRNLGRSLRSAEVAAC